MTTKKLSLLALVLFALRLSAPAQASLLSGAI